MDKVVLINALTLLSIGLMIFWKLTDPRSYKDKIKSYFSKHGILIGTYSFIFFALNYLSAIYFPLPESGFDKTLTWIGVGIFLIGFAISIWAKITIGKSWGIPGEHNKSRQNKLITSGPFHYTRNPIYVGLIMVLIGYGLSIQSYFTFLALLPIYYFSNSAVREEKLLEEIFKEEYRKYQRQVPRFF